MLPRLERVSTAAAPKRCNGKMLTLLHAPAGDAPERLAVIAKRCSRRGRGRWKVYNTEDGAFRRWRHRLSLQPCQCYRLGRRLGRVRRRTSAARPSAYQIAKRCSDLPPWLADRRDVFKICRCRRRSPSGLSRWARCSSIRGPSLMPTGQSDDERPAQMLGIRLFNAALR